MCFRVKTYFGLSLRNGCLFIASGDLTAAAFIFIASMVKLRAIGAAIAALVAVGPAVLLYGVLKRHVGAVKFYKNFVALEITLTVTLVIGLIGAAVAVENTYLAEGVNATFGISKDFLEEHVLNMFMGVAAVLTLLLLPYEVYNMSVAFSFQKTLEIKNSNGNNNVNENNNENNAWDKNRRNNKISSIEQVENGRRF